MSCVLIPSYLGHLEYVDKFLYSIKKLTPNNIDIFVVVGDKDYNEFLYLVNKYARVQLIIFSRILNIIDGIQMTDEDTQRNIDKSVYQSLKKYYGIYYLLFIKEYENVMIFDSESFCVREVDLNDIMTSFTENPFLLYSNIPYYGDQLKRDVILSTININGTCNSMAWFLDYYLWIYEKRVFQEFAQFILRTHGTSFYQLAKNQKILFIEVVYQTYIFNHNELYNYKLIEFVDYIASNYPNMLVGCLQCVNNNAPNKPIEDARQYIEQNKCEYADTFYNDLQLCVYKTSNTDKSYNFIKSRTSIKLCVSEFSDLIYNDLFPEYNTDVMCNWKLLLRNTVSIKRNLFRLYKKALSLSADNWIGFKINTPKTIKIKIQFELFFIECEEFKKENYVAIKKHKPIEIYKLPMQTNNTILNIWMKYECIMEISEPDCCILIFDNAPVCEVLVKNIRFTIAID